jgi:hypothetical protein
MRLRGVVRIGWLGCVTGFLVLILAAGCTGAIGDDPRDAISPEGLSFQSPIRHRWLTVGLALTAAGCVDLSRPPELSCITAACDAPDRDPRSWVLEGSNDGMTFTAIDTRAGAVQ